MLRIREIDHLVLRVRDVDAMVRYTMVAPWVMQASVDITMPKQ